VQRSDICGVLVAAAIVLLGVALSAYYGRFIGTHVADPYWPCYYGPKGTTCAATSFPVEHEPVQGRR
jgi:hypothetical protein